MRTRTRCVLGNPPPWRVIESDPGVFSLIMRDLGVRNVKVKELMGLDQIDVPTAPTFGLILLLPWRDGADGDAASSRTYDGSDEDDEDDEGDDDDDDDEAAAAVSEDSDTVTLSAVVGDKPTAAAGRLFFAKQVAPNACATQALLSIVMNHPRVELGEQVNGLFFILMGD